MSESTFFTYRPGDSPLHGLSPVTKLVCGGALVVAAFLVPNTSALAALFCLAVLSSVVASVWRPVVRTAIPILVPLGIGLVVLHGLFTPTKRTALVTLGPLTVWRNGVAFGLRTLLVLSTFVFVALVIVATTHPKRLTTALTEKGIPRKLSYVFLASLQFVPDLQRRARRILDAQQSRGLDVNGGLADRFRGFIALMSPLLIGALISAQTRSLALDARGFSRDTPRTHLYEVTEPWYEHVIQALALVGVLAVVGWRLLG